MKNKKPIKYILSALLAVVSIYKLEIAWEALKSCNLFDLQCYPNDFYGLFIIHIPGFVQIFISLVGLITAISILFIRQHINLKLATFVGIILMLVLSLRVIFIGE